MARLKLGFNDKNITMKTTLLFTLLTLFSVTSMAQTTHTFYVTSTPYAVGIYTISDTTVEVGDVVEFVSSLSSVAFDVKIDGVNVYSTPGTLSMGDVIYTHTFDAGMVGTMDIHVLVGIQPYFFQNIHFTVVFPSTSGVEDLSDVTFSVFPNPTSDFLNISTSNNIESVKVFDMNGRLVLLDFKAKVDVSSLENGVYTVLVNDDQKFQFVKE
jgi:plastocyanin